MSGAPENPENEGVEREERRKDSPKQQAPKESPPPQTAASSPTRAVRAAAGAGPIPQGDLDAEPRPEDSSATARALPGGHPEMLALDGNENDTRPWMLCIVDHDDARRLAEELCSLVTERLRIIICSTVMQALKHLQAVLDKGERVAVVMSEEPLAGMTGGGIWGLQKCRALVPESVRLLGLGPNAGSLLSFGLRKLKDADVHQVFDIATGAETVAKRLLVPLLEDPDDAMDESLRSATVRASTEVRMLTIPKETFADLLHRDAHLSIGITRELARRLRRQQQK